MSVTDTLCGLTDQELTEAFTRAADQVRYASMAYEPFVVERLRREILRLLPDAVRVTFTTEEWENGIVLAINEVFDADGNEMDRDILRFDDEEDEDDEDDAANPDHAGQQDGPPPTETISSLLADLTDCWGVYADDMDLIDHARVRDLGEDQAPVDKLTAAALGD